METSLGIDLASQNKNTATCLIEWRRDRARATRPRVGNDEPGDAIDWLVDAARAATWVGIDAPFGWPDPTVEAMLAWHACEPWPDVGPDSLRFRATDRHIIGATRLRPLSVSSDRIAVVAWRCARLLTALRVERGELDRIGGGAVFEVYPAAALSRWELNSKGYKTRGTIALRPAQEKARAALVDQLQEHAPWLDLTDALEACVESDHALDALIASLIARAAAKHMTDSPAEDELDRLRREGWIHLPHQGSLASLGETPEDSHVVRAK